MATEQEEYSEPGINNSDNLWRDPDKDIRDLRAAKIRTLDGMRDILTPRELWLFDALKDSMLECRVYKNACMDLHNQLDDARVMLIEHQKETASTIRKIGRKNK